MYCYYFCLIDMEMSSGWGWLCGNTYPVVIRALRITRYVSFCHSLEVKSYPSRYYALCIMPWSPRLAILNNDEILCTNWPLWLFYLKFVAVLPPAPSICVKTGVIRLSIRKLFRFNPSAKNSPFQVVVVKYVTSTFRTEHAISKSAEKNVFSNLVEKHLMQLNATTYDCRITLSRNKILIIMNIEK